MVGAAVGLIVRGLAHEGRPIGGDHDVVSVGQCTQCVNVPIVDGLQIPFIEGIDRSDVRGVPRMGQGVGRGSGPRRGAGNRNDNSGERGDVLHNCFSPC